LVTRQETSLEAASVGADSVVFLRAAIEREYPDLRRGMEALAWKLSLSPHREQVTEVAEEVLHEAILRALQRAEAFDPSRSAHAWLFGFALNVLRERQRAAVRDQRHLVSGDEAEHPQALPAAAFAAELYGHATDRLLVNELLELVAPADRQVLT
jgi:DNA-directed RNA polymerase specialized sigma24 family protein